MKTQTITSKRERFAEWQTIHKQLLGTDAQYRKRHTSFLITFVCLSCIMLTFYRPFFGIRSRRFAGVRPPLSAQFGVVSSDLRRDFHCRPLGRATPTRSSSRRERNGLFGSSAAGLLGRLFRVHLRTDLHAGVARLRKL